MAYQRLNNLKLIKDAEPGDEKINNLRQKMAEAQSMAWSNMIDDLGITQEGLDVLWKRGLLDKYTPGEN